MQPAAPFSVARGVVQNIEAELVPLGWKERGKTAPGNGRLVKQAIRSDRRDLKPDFRQKAGLERFATAPAIGRGGAVLQQAETKLNVIGIISG